MQIKEINCIFYLEIIFAIFFVKFWYDLITLRINEKYLKQNEWTLYNEIFVKNKTQSEK